MSDIVLGTGDKMINEKDTVIALGGVAYRWAEHK